MNYFNIPISIHIPPKPSKLFGRALLPLPLAGTTRGAVPGSDGRCWEPQSPQNLEGFYIPALPNLRKWALSSSSALGTSWKREIQMLYSYGINRRQHFSISVSAWKGRNLNLHLSTSWSDMQKCIFIRIIANLGLKKEWDFPCVLCSAREVGQKQMHAC